MDRVCLAHWEHFERERGLSVINWNIGSSLSPHHMVRIASRGVSRQQGLSISRDRVWTHAQEVAGGGSICPPTDDLFSICTSTLDLKLPLAYVFRSRPRQLSIMVCKDTKDVSSLLEKAEGPGATEGGGHLPGT